MYFYNTINIKCAKYQITNENYNRCMSSSSLNQSTQNSNNKHQQLFSVLLFFNVFHFLMLKSFLFLFFISIQTFFVLFSFVFSQGKLLNLLKCWALIVKLYISQFYITLLLTNWIVIKTWWIKVFKKNKQILKNWNFIWKCIR